MQSQGILFLKCTGDVLKVLKLRKERVAEADGTLSSAPLGHWYVHRFRVDRRWAYLFMSESTFLSFVLFQGKKPVTAETLPLMFLAGLEQLLTMKGFSAAQIDMALSPYSTGLFAKTDSRKTLGVMNDLVRCYASMIEFDGGLASCDVTRIIFKLNDMPQRTLSWKSSWQATEKLLDPQATNPTCST